jgi:hypothetical protein
MHSISTLGLMSSDYLSGLPDHPRLLALTSSANTNWDDQEELRGCAIIRSKLERVMLHLFRFQFSSSTFSPFEFQRNKAEGINFSNFSPLTPASA